MFKLEDISIVSYNFQVNNPHTILKKQNRKKSELFDPESLFRRKDKLILDNHLTDELPTSERRFDMFFPEEDAESTIKEFNPETEYLFNFEEEKSILNTQLMDQQNTCQSLRETDTKKVNEGKERVTTEEPQKPLKEKKVQKPVKESSELGNLNSFSQAYQNMLRMKKKGRLGSPRIGKRRDKVRIGTHLRRKLEKVKTFWLKKRAFLPSTFKVIRKEIDLEASFVEFRDFSMKGLKNDQIKDNNSQEERKDSLDGVETLSLLS